jgi:hypothetical protein
MKEIQLTRGAVTLVDDDDYDRLNVHKWHLHSDGYAVRNISLGHSKQTQVKMHRVIMNASNDVEVDHINRVRLDNRKCNLRIVTRTQNMHNCGRKGGKAGYKGVFKITHGDRWYTQIGFQGKTIYLGSFDTKEEAAQMYDLAAIFFYGEYARFNFPFTDQADHQDQDELKRLKDLASNARKDRRVIGNNNSRECFFSIVMVCTHTRGERHATLVAESTRDC